jgi:hypothetical protein
MPFKNGPGGACRQPDSRSGAPAPDLTIDAFIGLAIGYERFALHSPMLIAAGAIIGTARLALTLLMAMRADRRKVFARGGTGSSGGAVSSMI